MVLQIIHYEDVKIV